ncbi:MAG: hypothetical protein ACYDD1_03415 [Caulobacteraceae bacterium]
MKQAIFAFGLWAAALGVAHAQAPLTTAAPSSDEVYTAATANHMSASISTPPLAKPAASGDTTDAQIAGWLSSEQGNGDSDAGPGGQPSAQPRAIHGEMGVSVGSNGYRNVYGVTDIPIGQNSDLGLAASNSSYNGRHGYGGGSQTSLGVSLRLGSPSGASSNPCGMNRSVWLPTDDQAAANCAAGSSRY